jgi:hypothetical protein
MTAYIETTYERYGSEVKGWKNADTVIFLVWCDPSKKEAGRKKGENRVASFLKQHPEATPAGENGTAYNGECLAYNGEWIIEYRLENVEKINL